MSLLKEQLPNGVSQNNFLEREQEREDEKQKREIKTQYLESIDKYGFQSFLKLYSLNKREVILMHGKRKATDFISGFEKLSMDEQKEVIKKLMSKFCQMAMEDENIIQEMMPECMEMMKRMDFSMKGMMCKMMDKI
ncbi:MAG: hypothetical protein NC932_00995 [Candidatus Omnitrophica bacterium]|nr:hypothetical protein [Candidatus Omnitrophota bacterium]